MLKKLLPVALENHNFLLLHLTFASHYQLQKVVMSGHMGRPIHVGQTCLGLTY